MWHLFTCPPFWRHHQFTGDDPTTPFRDLQEKTDLGQTHRVSPLGPLISCNGCVCVDEVRSWHVVLQLLGHVRGTGPNPKLISSYCFGADVTVCDHSVQIKSTGYKEVYVVYTWLSIVFYMRSQRKTTCVVKAISKFGAKVLFVSFDLSLSRDRLGLSHPASHTCFLHLCLCLSLFFSLHTRCTQEFIPRPALLTHIPHRAWLTPVFFSDLHSN